ncbi:MAG: sulfatase-like hydrolase/transferase, partial [Chlorobi bacterium]|nr:sulfatase-like hydrolase/transferase [Chlorobiota bacterium]
AEVTYMDGQVGDILQALKGTGKDGETMVFFTSEQGSQFPGNKWTCWDTGLHTALTIRWPGKVPAGKRTDALVQYADVLPTILEAAGPSSEGGASPGYQFDGSSFLPVLLGKAAKHREFVYGMHNNIPEGPAYPIRTVSDGEYRYISNLRPEEIYIAKYLMGIHGDGGLDNPYWATWLYDTESAPYIYKLVKRYMRRPAEQLYHTTEDRYEMENLANDPSQAGRLAIMRAELGRWMTGQGDPGSLLDTKEAIEAARQGRHLYKPK